MALESIRKPINSRTMDAHNHFIVCYREAGSTGPWKALEGHPSVNLAREQVNFLTRHVNFTGSQVEFTIYRRDEIRFIGDTQ